MTENHKAYWRDTLRLLTEILIVWAVVAYGLSILLAPYLNQFKILGYPAGFWFAQQGSIYIFLILVFYYAWRMGKIDKKHHVEED